MRTAAGSRSATTSPASMQQIWRLDAAAGQELGSVRADGQGQLITRNPQTGAAGVEIRNARPQSRGHRPHESEGKMPATGWHSDADALNVTLNLPPGWRLFALFGADWVRGDWLTAWTLLDLVPAADLHARGVPAVGRRRRCWPSVGFGLSYHEPGAPRYLWLMLLIPLALLRVVPEGWAPARALQWASGSPCWRCVLVLVPFIARQIQQALYPQLEIVSGGRHAGNRSGHDRAISGAAGLAANDAVQAQPMADPFADSRRAARESADSSWEPPLRSRRSLVERQPPLRHQGAYPDRPRRAGVEMAAGRASAGMARSPPRNRSARS